MEEKKTLYKLNDDILFRKCSLYDADAEGYGDCSNWSHGFDFGTHKNRYSCKQYGIHYHCAKHPEVELQVDNDAFLPTLICAHCNQKIQVKSFDWLRSECLRLLNMDLFKKAKIIRLDEYYVPEVSTPSERVSDYWVKTNVKTDKDGDTIIVVYVGKAGEKDKVQYFIKPEKLQLTSDHKDLDPATIISKIEVTLKDRKFIQEYEQTE